MKMTFRKVTAGDIDFSEWNLPSFDHFRSKILEVLEDMIKGACDEPAEARLPFIWGDRSDGEGGPSVTDPLAIRVRIPIGGNEDNMPTWDLNLGDFLEDEIDQLDGTFSENDADLLIRMRERLTKIVARIDTVISTQTK